MNRYYNREVMELELPGRKRHEECDTDPLLLTRKGHSEEDCFLLVDASRRYSTTSPLSNRLEVPQHEQDGALMYHAACIIKGVWNWIRGLSLPIRIVLAFLTLYMLSLVINVLVQLVLQSMGSVYTILGIVASALVIYEFFHKRQQKRSG